MLSSSVLKIGRQHTLSSYLLVVAINTLLSMTAISHICAYMYINIYHHAVAVDDIYVYLLISSEL